MPIRDLSAGRLSLRLMDPISAPLPATQSVLDSLSQWMSGIQSELHERDDAAFERALAELFEMGVLRLTVPAEYGGLGVNLLDFCRVIRLVAQADPALAFTAVPHLCNGVKSVARFGSEAQKQEIFRSIVAERRLIAFAATEAHTGSDIASHQASLRPAAHGGYRLDGAKTWITNVGHSDHWLVLARCKEGAEAGGSALVLVRRAAPGVTLSKPWKKLGVRASATVDLYFDGVVVGPSDIIGKLGGAMHQFHDVVLSGRLGAAAGACGIGERAYRLWADAAERTSAETELAAWARRSLRIATTVLERSAAYVETGAGDAELVVAVCKFFCTRLAESVVQRLFVASCARSSSERRALEKLVRDVGIFGVVEGPNELLEFRTGVAILTGLRRQATEENWAPAAWNGLRQHLAELASSLAEAAGNDPLARPACASAAARACAEAYAWACESACEAQEVPGDVVRRDESTDEMSRRRAASAMRALWNCRVVS